MAMPITCVSSSLCPDVAYSDPTLRSKASIALSNRQVWLSSSKMIPELQIHRSSSSQERFLSFLRDCFGLTGTQRHDRKYSRIEDGKAGHRSHVGVLSAVCRWKSFLDFGHTLHAMQLVSCRILTAHCTILQVHATPHLCCRERWPIKPLLVRTVWINCCGIIGVEGLRRWRCQSQRNHSQQ
eukprot:COSAG06_NODE_12756_length_1334_cov_0.848583_3_plen_182_part_00